jgi:photosystem II stability/assembly factor-like uncharacterized protein
MDDLRIEIFTPREKRAAAVFAIAAVLLAVSVTWVLRSGTRPGPAGSPLAAVPTPPAQRTADFIFLSGSAAYALTGRGRSMPVAAYRTGDGARTWQRLRLPNGAGGVPLYAQAVGGTPLLLAMGNPNGASTTTFWFSPDGRSGWRRFPVPELPGRSTYLHLLDARTAYVLSRPYFSISAGGAPISIYWTADAGASWRETLYLDESHATAGALDISGPYTSPVFVDPQRGWMMTGSFVPRASGARPLLLRTDDGGSTWNRVEFPTAPVKSFLLGTPVFPDHGDHGYLALDGSSGLLVYETRDGGTTWADPYPAGVPWFSAAPDRWVYGDGRNLMTSRDWGRSWSTTPARLPGSGLALGFVEAAGPALWAYDNGTGPGLSTGTATALMRSLDGGASWTRMSWPGS